MTSLLIDPASSRSELLQRYLQVRSKTEALCEPLEREDMAIQTMPDVSPTKWHLAHTSWFFETLVLLRGDFGYSVFDPCYAELFNSYYRSLGAPYPRDRRGLLSRPTVPEVIEYRRYVDDAVTRLLENGSVDALQRVAATLRLGLHHEQQHQELLLMDVKHVLCENPLRPSYRSAPHRSIDRASPMAWRAFQGGSSPIGSSTDEFTFDNERPQHEVVLAPFELASRLVTCGEYCDFIEDGGYQRPELWLADGWDTMRREGWRAPLYWDARDHEWTLTTLGGQRELDRAEPVCHVSYYEADAYATWAGLRLPTEFEWEHVARNQPVNGNFLESEALHPTPARPSLDGASVSQLFSDVWEWTSSPYSAYPGYEPFVGELGEYNGKFMINQLVLRGGSCVTPQEHTRATYRNFYYPGQRWMFSGIRLAR